MTSDANEYFLNEYLDEEEKQECKDEELEKLQEFADAQYEDIPE